MRFERHRFGMQIQLKGPDVNRKCLRKSSSLVKDESDNRTSPGMVVVLEL
jgi:hypothetical protein